jgi:hypothetical protein
MLPYTLTPYTFNPSRMFTNQNIEAALPAHLPSPPGLVGERGQERQGRRHVGRLPCMHPCRLRHLPPAAHAQASRRLQRMCGSGAGECTSACTQMQSARRSARREHFVQYRDMPPSLEPTTAPPLLKVPELYPRPAALLQENGQR